MRSWHCTPPTGRDTTHVSGSGNSDAADSRKDPGSCRAADAGSIAIRCKFKAVGTVKDPTREIRFTSHLDLKSPESDDRSQWPPIQKPSSTPFTRLWSIRSILTSPGSTTFTKVALINNRRPDMTQLTSRSA